MVEWRNILIFSLTSNPVTFQVVFFENFSDIMFNYKNVVFEKSKSDNDKFTTIRIQVDKTQAIMYSYNTQDLSNESVTLPTELCQPST